MSPREQLERLQNARAADRRRRKAEEGKLMLGLGVVGTPVVTGFVRGALPWAATIPGTTIGTDSAVGALLFAWGIFGRDAWWPLVIGGSMLGGGLARRAEAAGVLVAAKIAALGG